MPKFIVMKPWRDGQKVGDVVELSKLHHCLSAHVKAFWEQEKELKEETPPKSQTSNKGK